MPIEEREVETLAGRILAAGDAARSIPPVTDGLPDFGLRDAYRVLAAVTARRIARGERPVGWKIGFTNETIWDEYGVHAPIWGPMYESSAAAVDPEKGPAALPVAGLVEPRIEPEIAFRLAAVPDAEMGERELLTCIDAVAHGFEIVQSIFPGWRFKAADTVAAFALHGRYRYGPFAPIGSGGHARWLAALGGFEIALFRNGIEVDRGIAGNVLGAGPLTALRHFVRALPEFSPGWRLKPGDIVTTGTLTRAFPVAAGERWSTRLTGLALPGMDVILE